MTEIPTSPWKVKIYENIDNVWTDRGTGYCIGQIVQNQQVSSDGSNSISHEAFLTVYAENSHDELILKTRVFGGIHYHKQQDSLIVWSELNDSEMCLSFQEAKGCSTLCEFLIFVQNNFEHDISVLAIKSVEPGSEETVTELLAGPLTYPPEPSISNLEEIIEALNNSTSTQYDRDAIVKYIHDSEFIYKLVNVFSIAEDLESLPDLHNLCRIMKMLFLMNDNSLLETLLKEENIMPVIGMLEYDPDFPKLKANHREYLSDESKFKEVIPIGDTYTREKIKQTFWLQFLKDVVLARLLDDPTFSMLTSLIYFNQVEIIQYIQKSDDYTNALFRLYEGNDNEEDSKESRNGKEDQDGNSDNEKEKETEENKSKPINPSIKKKRDGVRFVHQMSIVAKSFQLPQRAILYANFIRHGLFNLIDFALKDDLLSIRVLGSELMVTIIEQDPNLVRYTDEIITSDKSKNKKYYNERVINVFIDLLNNDEDLGLKSQATEGLKVLLDIGGNSTNYSSSLPSSVSEQYQKQLGDDFEVQFYSKSAPRLFSKLIKLSSNSTEIINQEMNNASETMSTIEGRASYEQLLDLLSFCIRQHRIPCRNFVIHHNLWSGISKLISIRHKQVRLAAVRCLKQGTLTDDIYYIRSICLTDALGSLLDVLIAMGHQNNLIHSSCLELLTMLDSISNQQESRRPITAREVINNLVDNYKEKLLKLEDTEIAQSIINHYEEQQQHDELNTTPIPAGRIDSTMTEDDSRLDSAFEENRYTFSNENGPSSTSAAAAAAAAAAAFGLVDYGEEEDDDEGVEDDNSDTAPVSPSVGLKRQSSISDDRSPQRRRVNENDDETASPNSPTSTPPETSSGTLLEKKKSGHFRRTLATAGKKLSLTLKRDKDKAVTSD